jgi:hypothetical protein
LSIFQKSADLQIIISNAAGSIELEKHQISGTTQLCKSIINYILVNILNKFRLNVKKGVWKT